MKVNVEWNEWNGLMWNGVIGDPNCGKNDDRISIDVWSSLNVEWNDDIVKKQDDFELNVWRWIRIDVCYDNNGKKCRWVERLTVVDLKSVEMNGIELMLNRIQ